nr:PREDICTED: mitochondrial thiamine pyrophosphate carrier-like [Megachile rotundata]
MSDSSKKEDHISDHFIAGASSGFITRFCCQPLDVIKIRFQLQVEPITEHPVSKYHSIIHAFYSISQEEGIRALWKGHVPAQLLSITYGMSQFYSYNLFMKLKDNFSSHNEWVYSAQFIAGANAGLIATVVSYPFDTIRTRLVAQSSNHQVYNGIIHSCSCIMRHESPRVFFYGLLPTALQIAPHTGLQFAFYGLFTDICKKYSHETTNTFYISMISGSAAGLLAKSVVYPFDLTRKRLQIQGFKHGRVGFGTFFECEGFVDCFKMTLKKEGVKGLFKGLVPSQIKAAVTTALHFTAYEQSLVAIEAFRSYVSK